MTTEAFAETTNTEILKSLFDDQKTYNYFKEQCERKEWIFSVIFKQK